MKKRILPLAMAAAMTWSMVPVSALASEVLPEAEQPQVVETGEENTEEGGETPQETKKITEVTIGITAPVAGEAKDNTVAVLDKDVKYTVAEIEWKKFVQNTEGEEGSWQVDSADTFAGNTVYQATIVLTANEGCKFSTASLKSIVTAKNGNELAGGISSSVLHNETILTIEYTFPSTAPAKEVRRLTLTAENSAVTWADDLKVELKLTDDAVKDRTDVVYSSSDENVATVAAAEGGALVTVLKAGTVTITASAEANMNYAAANTSYTLSIEKAAYKGDPATAVTAEDVKVTYDSIQVINRAEGHEYACVKPKETPVDWRVGGEFTGLEQETEYLVYARVAATETHAASELANPYAITTPKKPITPSTPTVPETPAEPEEPAKPSRPSGGSSRPSSKPSVSEKEEADKTETADKTTTETAPDGTVTETTQNADGTVTETVTTPDGMITETVTASDGAVTETVTTPDGIVTTIRTDADGGESIEVSVSENAAAEGAVTLPISSISVKENSGDASPLTVHAPAGQDAVTVTVPLSGADEGTVAVVVNPDGTETIIRDAVVGGGSMMLTVADGTTLKFIDNSREFTDVSDNSWFKDAVDFASSHELFSGTSDTTFTPDETMTRGMLATVLHNLANNPDAGSETEFRDVNDQYFADAATWAAQEGIISGYGDGQFGADDAVTREQLAVMLYRFADMPAPEDAQLSSSDAEEASPYAKEALQWAVENNVMSGDRNGNLMPKSDATRAQVASMLMRFCKNV